MLKSPTLIRIVFYYFVYIYTCCKNSTCTRRNCAQQLPVQYFCPFNRRELCHQFAGSPVLIGGVYPRT